MAFTLRDVPTAMRRVGWPVGARLMERWFASQSYAMDLRVKTGDIPPRANSVETRLVTMDWAMTFARANTALVQLRTEWSNPQRLARSQPVIARQLRRWVAARQLPLNAPFRFGDLGADTLTVDQTSAINFQGIDSDWFASVDDFYAALGRAAIKIAVSGTVAADGTNWRLSIDEIGFYLRDTYDFIGDQRLGSWGPKGFSSAAVGAPAIEIDPAAEPGWWSSDAEYFTVDNAAFRRWRGQFGRGGDFVIFSDLRRSRLLSPVVVTVPQ